MIDLLNGIQKILLIDGFNLRAKFILRISSFHYLHQHKFTWRLFEWCSNLQRIINPFRSKDPQHISNMFVMLFCIHLILFPLICSVCVPLHLKKIQIFELHDKWIDRSRSISTLILKNDTGGQVWTAFYLIKFSKFHIQTELFVVNDYHYFFHNY